MCDCTFQITKIYIYNVCNYENCYFLKGQRMFLPFRIEHTLSKRSSYPSWNLALIKQNTIEDEQLPAQVSLLIARWLTFSISFSTTDRSACDFSNSGRVLQVASVTVFDVAPTANTSAKTQETSHLIEQRGMLTSPSTVLLILRCYLRLLHYVCKTPSDTVMGMNRLDGVQTIKSSMARSDFMILPTRIVTSCFTHCCAEDDQQN